MGYGYHLSVRAKAVAAYDAGHGTIEEVAKIFQIGSATLKRWLWLRRDNANLNPRPHGGGNTRKLSDADIAWLQEQRPLHADRTVLEWCAALAAARNVSVSRSAMNRVFGKLGWTRKKSR